MSCETRRKALKLLCIAVLSLGSGPSMDPLPTKDVGTHPLSATFSMRCEAAHDGCGFNGIPVRLVTAQNSRSWNQCQFGGSGGADSQGSDHLLQGPFCHWSGSSGGGSGYSHSIRAYFDGQGGFQYRSESAFSGGSGQAYGTGSDASNVGAYRVAGDRVYLSFSDGTAGVAFVHNRKADGTITELLYDGDLYAPSLCE